MKEIQLDIQNVWHGSGILNRVIFNWKYVNMNRRVIQKEYRITIKKKEEVIYTSGWKESDKQNQITCNVELSSNKKYYAVVETKDTEGNYRKSNETIFLTGVKEEDWKAKWISAGTKKPFLASKRFRLNKKADEAVIAISGMGQFIANLNGKKIGNTVLDGSWTDYDKTVSYRVFDVSELLCEGENLLTIEVGNGWYLGDTSEGRHFYTRGEHAYHEYGESLCCLVQMSVHMGQSEVQIFSDDTWKIWPSDVLMTNIYGSEDQDASKRVSVDLLRTDEGKRAIELPKDKCPKGKLKVSSEPPIMIQKSYKPVSIKKIGEKLVYDFGQNMSGLFEVRASGQKGSMIKVIPAEKTDMDGMPVPSVNTYCRYTLSGKEEDVFCPKFCYAAGRWVIIEGAETDEGSADQRKPKILSVIGHFITSAAEKCGEFKASDYRYEQILNLVENAIDSNLNYVHTDCPSVEKLGWLETSHLMGPSVMFLRHADTLWSKIAADMRDAQYGEEEYDIDINDNRLVYEQGLIPSIAPRYARFLHAGDEGSFWDIVPWGSSILFSAYWQKCFYNNQGVEEENFEHALRYVEYLWNKYQQYNEIYHKSGKTKFLCHGLGDWGIEQGKGRSRENIETAFLYKDLKILSEWAKKLGRSEEQICNARAEEVLSHYNKELLKQGPDGEWFYDAYDSAGGKITQVNQAIPLEFGMVPAEKEESVRKSFIKTISGGKIDSGEIGLRFVFHQAAKCKQQDQIHKMIMQKEHPSYYRFIEQGETTLPEFWRDDARSRNHDMMGHVVEWFYRDVAGIWSEDGYHTIYINPELPAQLEWIDCTYRSISGKIRVSCKIEGENPMLYVELPPNTIGEINCPDRPDIQWERKHLRIEGGGVIKIGGMRKNECGNQMAGRS